MLQVFKNDELGAEVRTFLIEGTEYFMAKDVADILGYSETYSMTRRLDEEDVKSWAAEIAGQLRDFLIINESGLYTAILGSNKPNAKKFKKWITSEVIPSIRKTGSYSISLPTNYIEALKQLVKTEEEKIQIQFERDEAIRTKAHVSKGREGQLFAKTGLLTKQLNKAEEIIEELTEENKKLKITPDLTVTGFALFHHIELSRTEAQQYGKELSKICRENGIEIHTIMIKGEKYANNVYPESILIDFFTRQGYDLN